MIGVMEYAPYSSGTGTVQDVGFTCLRVPVPVLVVL